MSDEYGSYEYLQGKSTPKALAHLTEVVRAAYVFLTPLYVPVAVMIHQYSGEPFKSLVEPY